MRGKLLSFAFEDLWEYEKRVVSKLMDFDLGDAAPSVGGG